MSETESALEPLEPERFELFEADRYRFDLTRRELLRSLGGGIVVLCFARALPAQESGRRGGGSVPDEIGAWLHIAEDGTITAHTGKVEVGQGIRTSLAQVVAEELRVPVDSVGMVMGDTALVPYDRGTFGSRTTPTMAPQLQRAAAAAREALIDIARERWEVEREDVVVRDGRVELEDGSRTLTFGELTAGRELVAAIAADVVTTPVADQRVVGTAVPRAGARELVTGDHRYPSDVVRPGMLHGKVLRPTTFGAELVAVDLAPAQSMPGVTVVHDGEFVGVAAPDELTAQRALAAIDAEWKSAPRASHGDLFAYLMEHADEGGGGRGRGPRARGSLEDGFAQADQRLQATYTVAYIAHAPLEPRAAVAEWEKDKLSVWTGTQRPFGVRSELARAFGVPEEDVRVRVPETGSGYGGKHTGEAAVEAARLARAAGKPVKLRWTREEEFTWAYLRPGGVIEVESGFRADGTLTAWRFRNINSGSSGMEGTYAIDNQELVYSRSDSPLRQGSYRALASTANHFARETHLDEIARAVELDPLALRLLNLTDERQRAVLEAAAERFGWGAKTALGRGVGIACGFEKAGYVATCAEVSVDRRGGIQVERLVAAFECGAIHNPDGLENQVAGALIMGLGGALFEAIDFRDGRLVNPRFSAYRVPRFSDVPLIDVVLLDRPDLPSAGAGESPIIAVAPAVGNAIFDATGERRRSMPMV